MDGGSSEPLIAARRCLSARPARVSTAADNAAIFHFELSAAEVAAIDALAANAPDGSGRLCWVNDPLRMLDFDPLRMLDFE